MRRHGCLFWVVACLVVFGTWSVRLGTFGSSRTAMFDGLARLSRVRASLAVVLVTVSRGRVRLGGGSSGTRRSPRTLERSGVAPARTSRIIPGTHEYGLADVRISFLVVRPAGSDRRAATRARLDRAQPQRGRRSRPRRRRSEPVGARDGRSGSADVSSIYVDALPVPKPGHYWIVAEPVGGRAIGGARERRRRGVPARRPRSAPAPTRRGRRLSRARRRFAADDPAAAGPRPAPRLGGVVAAGARAVRARVRDAELVREPDLRAGRRRRRRGAKRYARRGIRFIHVEIYRDNNPANGLNRWVQRVAPAVRAVDVPRRAATAASRRSSRARSRLGELSTAVRRNLLVGRNRGGDMGRTAHVRRSDRASVNNVLSADPRRPGLYSVRRGRRAARRPPGDDPAPDP